MKTRFFFMTLLVCLLLAAWIWLELQYEEAQGEKLRQLSALPVYVYVADSTNVAPLLERLSDFSQLQDIDLETGLQAADELVKAYQLPIGIGSLQEYQFPSVVTLLFKPILASIEAKPLVLNAIRESRIELSDIDAQSNAWTLVTDEIKTLRARRLGFTIFSALLMALLFFFLRLSFELRFLLMQKRKTVSVADTLRITAETQRRTWLMLIIPLAFSIGVYFLLGLGGVIQGIIPLWWFAIPCGSVLLATIALILRLNVYFHNDTILAQIGEAGDAEDSL